MYFYTRLFSNKGESELPQTLEVSAYHARLTGFDGVLKQADEYSFQTPGSVTVSTWDSRSCFKWCVWPAAAKAQEHQLSSTHVLQNHLGDGSCPLQPGGPGKGGCLLGPGWPPKPRLPLRLSTFTGGVACQLGTHRSVLVEEKHKKTAKPNTQPTVCIVTSGAAGLF